MSWIKELFDFRMKRFFSMGYLRVAYLIFVILVMAALVICEGFCIFSVIHHMYYLIFVALLAPFVAALLLIVIRIQFEFLLAFFYMESHLRKLSDRKSKDLLKISLFGD